MSELLKLCAAAVIALAATLILKDSRSPHPELVAVFLGVCVMSRALMNITDVVAYVRGLASGSVASGYLKVLLKAVGIAYLTDFTADICRDAGEGTIASYVEIAGKTELLILALPLMTELLELSLGMLNV